MQPPRIPDHELLRRIGRGSYGEVWLARNALGTARAVKVVHRSAFESARPYEREFGGIQRFEPVSRSHDGLVDILQVGRNDGAGFFYYVMELADPVDPPESAAYQPRTLAAELRRRGRLPVAEGLPIFLSLTTGLGHLHQRGLVHRDIKPSNIIFVNGVAKLADIGLVAEFTEAASFVGTEGFIPPEGPGTRMADIYSLGKVLYEAATGLDRTEFPSLPLERESVGRQSDLLELNAVIVKACAADPRQRYQTAEELAADLALLQSGRSVKRQRLVERRLERAGRVLVFAGLVTFLALAALGVSRFETVKQRRLRDRAERAEIEAREQLWRARINEARALRRGTDSGRRARALAALGAAAEVRVDHELRSEAAACLALTDLLEAPGAVPAVGPGTNLFWSPGLERYGVELPDGTLELHDTRGGAIALSLPGAGRTADRLLTFSPRGHWLFAASSGGRNVLWDVRPAAGVATNGSPWLIPSDWTDVGFSDDDRWVAFTAKKGRVRVAEIATRRVTELTLPVENATAQLSPDGSRIAFAELGDRTGPDDTDRSRWVRVWRCATGEVAGGFTVPLPVHGLYWIDAGRLAVLLSDATLRVRDLTEGRPELVLAGHKAAVTEFGVLSGTDLFFTASWDGTQRLWDLQSGTELLRMHTRLSQFQFAPGRRFLGAFDERVRRLVRFEILGDRAVASLSHPRSDRANGPWDGGFDRESRWFVSNDHDGARLWSVTDARFVGSVPASVAAGAVFDATRDALVTTWKDRDGQRIPWRVDAGGAWSFGAPEPLGTGPADWLRLMPAGAAAWHDLTLPGLVMRVRARPDDPVAILEPGRGGLPRFRSDLGQYAISSDARWICFSPRFDHRAWLLETATGRRVDEFQVRFGAYMVFTHDNHRLLLGDQERYWLWDIAGRSNVWEVPRRHDVGQPGRLSLTTDGSVLAVAFDRQIVQLLDARDGRELLRLEHPLPEHISNLIFSPDARYLAVFNETHVTHLWNLGALREDLVARGFGWEAGLERVGRSNSPAR